MSDLKNKQIVRCPFCGEDSWDLLGHGLDRVDMVRCKCGLSVPLMFLDVLKRNKERVSTGLSDSNGDLILVGDLLKIDVTINKEMHGDYAIYEIIQRGLTPVTSYVRSEKGRKLPKGYTGCSLCDMYDAKMFMFLSDLSDLRPVDQDIVIFERDGKIFESTKKEEGESNEQ